MFSLRKMVENDGTPIVKVVTPLMVVTVTGDRVISDEKCVGFSWEMEGKEFKGDLASLAVEHYDMLLGDD